MTTKKNKTVEDQLYEADQIAWKALGCPEGTYDTTNVERLVARVKELQQAAKEAADYFDFIDQRGMAATTTWPLTVVRNRDNLRNALASVPTAQSVDHEPIEMHSCEINFLILHPNTLYRFTPAPGCQACADYYNPKRSPRKLHKSIVITLTLALVASLITIFLILAQLP